MEATINTDMQSLLGRLDRLTALVEQLLTREKAETLLTQKDAARMLGKCSTTLRGMREEGLIKGTMIGKTWKYPLSEVERVMKIKI